jgi:F-type H+-transporting ATPase subunit epsilon
METIHLSIVTPLGKIYDDEVLSVTLPGDEGEFGVLPEHVGLMSILQPGVIEFVNKNSQKESIAIKWGGVKVDEHTVDVLVDEAVAIQGDTQSDIAKAIEDAKALLNEVKDSDAMLASVETKIESAARNLM